MTKAKPLVGLRAAAVELNVSRKKLLRLIRDGLPVTRKSERVYINVDEARDWIAENDTDGASTAPVLHPDDPRYREKLMAARLDWLRAAEEAGALVRITDAERRVADELTKLRTALLHSYTHFAPGELTLSNAGPAIATVLADAMTNVQYFDAATWPALRPVPPEPPVDFDPPSDDANFAARYSEADPRHAFHQGKAARAEATFAALADELMPLADVLAHGQKTRDEIAERLEQIPERIEIFAGPDDDLIDLFQNEVREALSDLSRPAL